MSTPSGTRTAGPNGPAQHANHPSASIGSLRRIVFLIANGPLRVAILWFLRIARPLGLIRFVFFVYPGSREDLEAYYQPLTRSALPGAQCLKFAGLVSCGSGRFGLIVGLPIAPYQLATDPHACHRVISDLQSIATRTGARAVALAGQMPSAFRLAGVQIVEPCVSGIRGTVFAVVETVRSLVQSERLDVAELKVVVVGVGHAGRSVLKSLRAAGFHALGVDVREQRGLGVLARHRAGDALKAADLVIVMTPKGTDFSPYSTYLRSDAIVIDDTHPMMVRVECPRLFKVAVGGPDVRFYPSLPRYDATWIPGCMLEAMVTSSVGVRFADQQSFDDAARRLGFFAQRIPVRATLADKSSGVMSVWTEQTPGT